MALSRERCQGRWSVLRGPAGRYLVLASPLPWAPGYPTLPELDVVRVGVEAGEFAAAREEVAGMVREFCEAAPDTLLRCHPLLGNMRWEDWMRWGYRHTDHHLRQFGR